MFFFLGGCWSRSALLTWSSDGCGSWALFDTFDVAVCISLYWSWASWYPGFTRTFDFKAGNGRVECDLICGICTPVNFVALYGWIDVIFENVLPPRLICPNCCDISPTATMGWAPSIHISKNYQPDSEVNGIWFTSPLCCCNLATDHCVTFKAAFKPAFKRRHGTRRRWTRVWSCHWQWLGVRLGSVNLG